MFPARLVEKVPREPIDVQFARTNESLLKTANALEPKVKAICSLVNELRGRLGEAEETIRVLK